MGFTAVNQVKKQFSEQTQNVYLNTTESRESSQSIIDSHLSVGSFQNADVKIEVNGLADQTPPYKDSPYLSQPNPENRDNVNFSANFSNPFMFFQGKSRANPPLNMATVERRGDNLDNLSHLNSQGKRLFDLPEAPTFHPTASEFNNPIEYINSIASQAKEFGMAKIIPPKEWNIQFCLDTEVFWFKTRRQNLQMNDSTSLAADKFVESVHYFHRLNRTGGMSMPNIDRRPLDLFRLHQCVSLRGGFQEVCKKKLWAQIGRELGYSGRIMSSLSSSLKAAYQKVLYPYDQYLEENGAADLIDGVHTPLFEAPNTKNTKTSDVEDPGLSKRPHSSSANGEKQTKYIKLHNGTKISTASENVENGSAKIAQFAPIVSSSQSNLKRIKPMDKTKISNHEWPHKIPIIIDDEKDFDFKNAPTYNLRQFQQKSAMFKFNYFASHIKETGSGAISQREVEEEYWKLLMDPIQNVEVESGRDLHSSIYGSAFPKIELYPEDSHAYDGWNLNTLAYDSQSLFRYVSSEIPYLADPWINIGMIFSTKSWHFQDFFSNLMHYHHFGDVKTWYSVPESDFEKMSTLLKQTIGEEKVAKDPSLLFESQYMFPPNTLKEQGINVCALNQLPGEFVVIFPKTWQAQIDHGFNLCENVNFSTGSNWLQYGRDCLKFYNHYNVGPPFSIPHTLNNAINNDYPVSHICSETMKQFEMEELGLRNDVRQKYLGLSEEKNHKIDEHRCCISNDICYFSVIQEKSDDIPNKGTKYYSLRTFLNMDVNKQDLSKYTLICMCSDDDLNSREVVLGKKDNISSDDWNQRLQILLASSPRVALSSLEQLESEGDHMNRPPSSLRALKVLLDYAKKFRSKLQNCLHTASNGPGLLPGDISLDSFNSLLEEATKVWFICPEIEELFSKARSIKAYRRQVNSLLQGSSAPNISMYQDLLKTGKQFHVNLPEIQLLEKTVSQIESSNKIDEKLQNPVDSHGTNGYIFQGNESSFTPEENNPIVRPVARPAEQLIKNDFLERKAVELLEGNVIQRRSLARILSDAHTYELSADILKELNKASDRAQSLDASAKALKDQSALPNIYDRPLYSDAKTILKEASVFDDKALSHEIGKCMRTVEGWMRRGKRLYGKANAPLYILGTHIMNVEKRDAACFAVDVTYEDDNYKNGSLVARDFQKGRTRIICGDKVDGNYDISTDSPDSENSQHLCICRQPESGLMLMCGVCKEWYHARCLKLGRGKGKFRRNDEFLCSVCNWNTTIHRDTTRPSIPELREWISSVCDLPYLPDEVRAAQLIVDRAQRYREFIRSKVLYPGRKFSKKDLHEIRYYTRRLEGAETALIDELIELYGLLKKLDPDRYEGMAIPDITTITSGNKNGGMTDENQLKEEQLEQMSESQ